MGHRKVLVIGSGARESAIVWKLSLDPSLKIIAAPGCLGMERAAERRDINATDTEALLSLATSEKIRLTIVGPEGPLVAGLADRFREHGLLVCGPSKAAAEAEGSKIWFAEFLARHNLPQPPYSAHDNAVSAMVHLRKRRATEVVIKADGLMAGKGVFLPETHEQAGLHLSGRMVKGTPGERVLIQDRVFGVERSVMAITDGERVVMLPFTQDYKRIGPHDSDPMTGGMGAHTVTLSPDESNALTKLVHDVVAALREEGRTYQGFIYLGVMMTDGGPKILECNCRLGDPETQVIMPTIRRDFFDLCIDAATGRLSRLDTLERQGHALCVVLASKEYPGVSTSDDQIRGLDEADTCEYTHLFHGCSVLRGSRFSTNKGGRILSVVGRGQTLAEARTRAYGAVSRISFYGMKYRRDIGEV